MLKQQVKLFGGESLLPQATPSPSAPSTPATTISIGRITISPCAAGRSVSHLSSGGLESTLIDTPAGYRSGIRNPIQADTRRPRPHPTASAGAAGASSRAGDGGRTRDPRLGKPMLYH